MRQYVVTVKYEIETPDDITEDDVLDDWENFVKNWLFADIVAEEQTYE